MLTNYTTYTVTKEEKTQLFREFVKNVRSHKRNEITDFQFMELIKPWVDYCNAEDEEQLRRGEKEVSERATKYLFLAQAMFRKTC